MNQRNYFYRITGLLLLCLIFSCGAAAQGRTWKKFSPASNDWTILAPGEMVADEAALKPNSDRGSHSYSDFAGFFAVVYRDAPKRRYVPWRINRQAYYEKIARDAAKAAKGEIIRRDDFTNGNISGREIYIKIPNVKVQAAESPTRMTYRIERMRMFFDNKRFYMVLAVLPEEEIDSVETNNYMYSFVLNETSDKN